MLTTGIHETRGEWLFRQMHALYGSRFLAMWRDVDKADLVRGWTRALHGMTPEALQAGVDALQAVPHPPTLPEFLELCRHARLRDAVGSTPKLPPPARSDPAIVKANLKRMREIIALIINRKPSPQWAFDMLLRGKAKNGAALTYEARRISIDAVLSPAGRAFCESAPVEIGATYRAVFNATLRERGHALPSRVPGEDDEEPERVTG